MDTHGVNQTMRSEHGVPPSVRSLQMSLLHGGAEEPPGDSFSDIDSLRLEFKRHDDRDVLRRNGASRYRIRTHHNANTAR